MENVRVFKINVLLFLNKMRKEGSYFLIVFIFLLFIASFASSGNESKVSKKVYDSLEDSEYVRVMVKFNDFSNNKGVKKADVLYDVQALKNEMGKGKIKHDFGNVASVFLSKEELYRIRNDPSINSIEIEPMRQIMLQNSVQIINSSVSWPLQQNNYNLTGDGQTICIIDTGINYSHSDFGSCTDAGFSSRSCNKVINGLDYCADDVDCSTWDDSPNDVNGHGTHVAGIATANGSINGVAPGANLVIFKACNSTGSCSDSDLRAGIDFCINSSVALNISVISMSIGGGLYTSYCDYQDDPYNLTLAINNATYYNISFVVSSGNNGEASSISSPACIQNATPIGSTTKTDAISSFSNRFPLMTLFAPGGTSSGTGTCTALSTDSSRICSTSYSGSYVSMSGTSMAAPHAAGAFAIVKEYLKLTGQTKTSTQIENAFNSTGLSLSDGSKVYRRIDVYSALVYFDINAPNVSLISPGNNSFLSDSSYIFNCNGSDLSLKNLTFFLWNSTAVYNQTFFDLSGVSYYNMSLNVSNISSGVYKWNCLFHDQNASRTFASANFTLNVGLPEVNLSSPLTSLFTKNNQTYTCNATSLSVLSNITFFLWNNTGIENSSVINVTGLSNGSSFSYNFIKEGDYSWNCLFVNSNGLRSFASSNNTVRYDIALPVVSVISPVNLSWYNAARLNASINENGTCVYSFNHGTTNNSMNSSDNRNFTSVNSTLLQGNLYNVTFYCNDSAGNLNYSDLINFNVDLIKPNVSSISPTDGYSPSQTGTQDVLFSYNASDNINLSSCSLVLDEVSVALNDSAILSNESNEVTYSVSSGTHYWFFNCSDIASNFGNSSLRSIVITASPSSTSSGGGGGAATTSIAVSDSTIGYSQVASGYSEQISRGGNIKFQILAGAEIENHTLLVNYVTDTLANLTLFSNPVNFALSIGQSAKFNLSSDRFYDLFVRLENISAGKVNLTIIQINEAISNFDAQKDVGRLGVNETGAGESGINSDTNAGKGYLKYVMYLAAFVLIVCFVYWLLFVNRKKKKVSKHNLKHKKKRK